MQDIIALWLIKLARKLTTWGFADDYLQMAEEYLIAREFDALDWDNSATLELKKSIHTIDEDGWL